MEFDFSILYDSDEKKFTGLDMYYGSRSLQGVAETIVIATHGIVNEKYISKTNAAKGFKSTFKSSFEGSFKQRFKITFTDPKTISKINTISPKSYIELLKHAIHEAIGTPIELTRRGSKNTFERMYFSEDITHRLFPSLKEVHGPVKQQGYKATLFVAQTPIATFNKKSLEYLEEEIISPAREQLVVGISRFNARTGTGRLITDIDEESYSFIPDMKLSKVVKRSLIDSLQGVAADEFKPVIVEVTRVTINDGSTKFFILHKVLAAK
ncbi:hypothetical protein [Pseudomonas sp. NPDC096950]|uniref:hypothetical protein n=1 Tax=Pseudomonas sp. NPDC096950 TaxID=3364485 RepID=UPI00383AECF3